MLRRLTSELRRRYNEIRDRRARIRSLRKGSARRTRLVRYQRKILARAQDLRNTIANLRRESAQWGGSRGVTNEIIRIVAGRAPITSRKRAASDPLSIANPNSDHSGQNLVADAVDFGTANNYALGREIAHRLGGSWNSDYQSFYIIFDGKRYRVQIIAGTHGTGPHLHVGVRRA